MMDKKVLDIQGVKRLTPTNFSKMVRDGFLLEEELENDLTSGTYKKNIANDVISDEKVLKRCLELLKAAGVKANLSKYNFNYALMKSKKSAELVLDAVDISTIDHNMVLDKIVRELGADVLNQAIEAGVLEGVAVDKYVLLAHSLGKTEHTLILASHDNGVKVEELSLDKRVKADEWEYKITPKLGLQLTKYTGDSNIIVIPSTYKGHKVKGMMSSFLDDNALMHSDVPIVVYYHRSSSDSKAKSLSIFYAIRNTKAMNRVFFVTNIDRQSVDDICHSNPNIFCSLSLCGCNYDNVPTLVNDFVICEDGDEKTLVRYVGNDADIVVPDGITNIGSEAFADNYDVKNLTIPSSVKSIGHNAFSCCYSILNVYVDDIDTWLNMKFANFRANPLNINSQLYVGGELLTKVVIPEDATSIGDATFCCCTSLESVEIPESVTSIGESAFYCCTSLKNIEIPESVTSIGDAAFRCCSSLKSVEIPSSVISIGDAAFCECKSLESIDISRGITSIANGTFAKCGLVESIDIPEGVTKIDCNAFLECSKLKSIKLPSTLTSIEEKAFDACGALEEVVIADGNDTYQVVKNSIVTKKEKRAIFNWTPKMIDDTLVIDDTTSVVKSMFEGNKDIKNVVISEGVENIGDRAFYDCTNLVSITFPNTLKKIGSSAFQGCTALKEVHIPDGVTKIGSSAFQGCTALKEVHIPDGVTNLSNSVFRDCAMLEHVNIPDTVTKIGNSTFSRCGTLDAINIPASVESIGNNAFEYCSTSNEVSIPISVKKVGKKAFRLCERCRERIIYCDAPSMPSGWEAEWKDVGEVAVWNYGQENGTTIDGFRWALCKDGAVEICGYKGDSAELVIPSSIDGRVVTRISGGAFMGLELLQSVSIADGIETIGDSAFRDCRYLKNVNIPDSVISIGDYAFNECRSLKTIYIPNSVEQMGYSVFNITNIFSVNVMEVYIGAPEIPKEWNEKFIGIGIKVIPNCGGKYGITSDGFKWMMTTDHCINIIRYSDNGENIVIPDEIEGMVVKGISNGAFSNDYNIQSIIVPKSVESIDDWAFNSCTALTHIEIPDGVTSIGYFTFGSCSSLANIEIPDSVTSISSSAFSGCHSLKTIYIPSSVENMDAFVFDKNSISISVAAESKPDGWSPVWNHGNPVNWGAKKN